jgi:hypothetical protein
VQILDADDGRTYRPGACNIGQDGIDRRRRFGVIGLAITAALVVALVVVDAAPALRLLIFPILAGSLVSLEEARRHFCAGLGSLGLVNFGSSGDSQRVEDAAARAIDRRASLILFGYCAFAAAAVTLLFALAPI